MMKGSWIFQSSFAFNLCGMGYLTGPWKSPSAYMKTFESTGAVGTTVFMMTTPNRYLNTAELCDSVSMPTSVTSGTHFMPLMMKAMSLMMKKTPMLISIPAAEAPAASYYAAGYAVGVL